MKQNRVLNNIVSPYGLAIISYTFFLFACLVPPSVYSHFVHEPDLMFLDPATILFYTLCVAAFLSGVWLFENIFPPVPIVERKFEVRFNPAAFFLIPLLLCVALSVLSSVLLVKNNPLVIPLMLVHETSELRAEDGSGLQFEGTLNSAVLFLIGVVWWLVWRYNECAIQGRGRRIVKVALALAVLAVFISSSLNLSRHTLVVLIAGLTVLYLLRKVFAGQLSWRLIGRTILIFVLGGGLFFFLIGWLRGMGSGSGQIDGLVGYTIASYNRLAALLQGRIHYEYSGKGIYFSNFLSFNHTFNRLIPVGRILNIPDYYDWWRSEFSSVGRAGLDSNLIFCGTFGDIFIEIGWFAPLYVFGYGLLYGLVWRWMREDLLIGILLYPYFAYVILFWFSTNALFEIDAVALVGTAIVLCAYEFLFASQDKGVISNASG